jgi:hypothetical protein
MCAKWPGHLIYLALITNSLVKNTNYEIPPYITSSSSLLIHRRSKYSPHSFRLAGPSDRAV